MKYTKKEAEAELNRLGVEYDKNASAAEIKDKLFKILEKLEEQNAIFENVESELAQANLSDKDIIIDNSSAEDFKNEIPYEEGDILNLSGKDIEITEVHNTVDKCFVGVRRVDTGWETTDGNIHLNAQDAAIAQFKINEKTQESGREFASRLAGIGI